jgi:anti-anti-sigma regulatory factor
VALRLVVTNPQIEKVLRITGLLGVFQVYSDLQTAVSDRR